MKPFQPFIHLLPPSKDHFESLRRSFDIISSGVYHRLAKFDRHNVFVGVSILATRETDIFDFGLAFVQGSDMSLAREVLLAEQSFNLFCEAQHEPLAFDKYKELVLTYEERTGVRFKKIDYLYNGSLKHGSIVGEVEEPKWKLN